jgi:hypothetical protein
MDSWFTEEPESGKRVSNVGESSSTEKGTWFSCCKERWMKKYPTAFLTFL